MIPQRVILENFLSFGPEATLDFTGTESLWVLGGPNGVGKSSVFDAITFALFGEHRGGYRRVDELIRHGADGFKIVFEFQFAGQDYRITRAYRKRKHAPPKLDRKVTDEWQPITAVTDIKELEAWVEQMLGMGHKEFTTSVLLKQGEADKLFSSSRNERNDVLKKIIGFEQYEGLAGRVKDANTKAKNDYSSAKTKFDNLTEVTPEELETARTEVEAAAVKVNEAAALKDAAIRREGTAKQWVELQRKKNEIENWLTDAAARSRTASEVLAKHARLLELNAAVPVLVNLAKGKAELEEQSASLKSKQEAQTQLRKQHDEAEEALKTLDVDSLTQQRDAAKAKRDALLQSLPQRKKHLELAKECEAARAKLDSFPKNLPIELQVATEADTKARKAERDANDLKQQVKPLLDLARKNLQLMKSVEVGVVCSRCRQPVTAEHAAAEVAALEREIGQLTDDAANRETNWQAAQKLVKETLETLERVSKQQAEFEKAKGAVLNHQKTLVSLGITQTAAELEDSIAAETRALQTAESELNGWEPKLKTANAEQERHSKLRKDADAKLRTLDVDLARLESNASNLTKQIEQERTRLPGGWNEDAEMLRLQQEWKQLQTERVAEQAAALQKDALEIDAKRAAKADLETQIELIAAEDRITPDAAKLALNSAEESRLAAERDANAAKDHERLLLQQQEEYRKATMAMKQTERQHELHKKLHGLLGEEGLMRDLIRDAELEVVRLADESLRQLTNQHLSLELNADDDKAFALQVRRAGESDVTRVEFISGSQRFRVAVSLALAIGRFAAGKSRPIEAVIIDEGFGSLDEDGLRTMAENLKDLRDKQSLARIILVSHQKNFTEQFTAGYRLIPGPDGTTVERIGGA